MSNREALQAERAGTSGRRSAGRYEILYDAKGNLLLPETPAHGDSAGLCAWLTAVCNLNSAHPITGGTREGLRGPEGHVVLARAGAAPIRFEPATRINAPAKLIETLAWMLLDTDGSVLPLKGEHCRQISYVVRMLCGATQAMTDAEEAEGIIGTFMQAAGDAVEGHKTYGTSGQRYEAAVALRRAVDGRACDRAAALPARFQYRRIRDRRLGSTRRRAPPWRHEPTPRLARRSHGNARLGQDHARRSRALRPSRPTRTTRAHQCLPRHPAASRTRPRAVTT